jgi:hypothetical protein
MTRYQYKKQKSASERGKRMASRRWELDAKKRELLARLDPISTNPIRRIIDIRGDLVTEVCIFEHDSIAAARQKIRAIGLVPAKIRPLQP